MGFVFQAYKQELIKGSFSCKNREKKKHGSESIHFKFSEFQMQGFLL